MNQSHTHRLCIGLPVYNGERYLAQAIESLLGQTFTDLRLIISDNASTDGTEAICRAFSERDRRVSYHRSPVNRGAAWNFNRVVALADAEYFKWAPHDDVYAPRFAERCVAALDAHPRAVVCYPTSHVIDEQGTVLSAYREPANATAAAPAERFRDMLWNWGCAQMLLGVMRLEVLRATTGMGAYPASDIVLLGELALRGEVREVDEPLFFWRNHAERPDRVCNSDAELDAWYAPENAGRPQLRHLRLFAHYLRAIARVPLSPDQRLRCLGSMAKWFLVKFPTIQNEVRGAIARPVRAAVRRRALRSGDSPSRAA
jgi:glycosyltransferase involved in cell wall biosynthesis